jgi:hypothetical protein
MDSSYARRPAVWLAGLCLVLLVAASAAAQPVAITIQEPYLELHSGPGRGYPAFHALERGAKVELLQRRTDWYQLRTARGVEGWVHRERLARTLEGVDPGLRAAVLERHLGERISLGLSAGILDDDPLIRFWGDYRFNPRYSAELSLSQAAGTFSSSRLYRLDLVARPWPEREYVPQFSLGVGYFDNVPRRTLVESSESGAPVYSLGVGVSKRLQPRFGLRLDWRYHYADFDAGSESLQELTAGFALHF